MRDDLKVFRVPGHYWHGFKALGVEPVWLVYFVTKLYDHKNPDEECEPWNDPTVIPKTISDETSDPKCGKPRDWPYLLHRLF